MPKQLPADFQTVETRCGREGHTRPRGPSESPDGVDPNIRRTRKKQRDGHNSGVKIWSLCSVSSTLSHANPWTTLSNLAIKREVKYICKEVFLCLPSCVFLRASVFIIESLWYGKWVYNNICQTLNAFVFFKFIQACNLINSPHSCLSVCLYVSLSIYIYIYEDH